MTSPVIYERANGNLVALFSIDARGAGSATIGSSLNLLGVFLSGGENIVAFRHGSSPLDPAAAEFDPWSNPFTLPADTYSQDALWVEWTGGNLEFQIRPENTSPNLNIFTWFIALITGTLPAIQANAFQLDVAVATPLVGQDPVPIIPNPLPPAFLYAASAFGLFGLLGRRRRRRKVLIYMGASQGAPERKRGPRGPRSHFG